MRHEDFTGADLRNEGLYDSVRYAQWRSGDARTDGMSRRALLLLTGRSWSGNGRIASTEVSTDGGATWRVARPRDEGLPHAWQLWEIPWTPPGAGTYTPRSRATDVTGATQPATVPYNTREYLYDGIVNHTIAVV
jgi:hypothetical protein